MVTKNESFLLTIDESSFNYVTSKNITSDFGVVLSTEPELRQLQLVFISVISVTLLVVWLGFAASGAFRAPPCCFRQNQLLIRNGISLRFAPAFSAALNVHYACILSVILIM